MGKAVLFILGLAIGAAGTSAWLTSEPEPGSEAPVPDGSNPLQLRLQVLTERLDRARAEGARTGEYTEEHLRRKLDAYRKGSDTSAPA